MKIALLLLNLCLMILLGCTQSNWHGESMLGMGIVQGQKSTTTDGLWQHAVFINLDETLCSGSLIHQQVILTAAHCLKGGSIEVIFTQPTGDKIIYVGKKVIIHPNFHHPKTRAANDIALIKIDPAPEGWHPLPLSQQNNIIGLTVIVSGFGKTLESLRADYQRQYTPQLNYAEMSTVGFDGENIVDMRGLRGQSACEWDSGGPVLMRENNRWYQVGLNRAAVKDCRGASDMVWLLPHLEFINSSISELLK